MEHIDRWRCEWEMELELNRMTLLAAEAHEGQVDRGGEDYFKHPLRVSFKMDTHVEKMVAMLHDVLEDTNLSLNDRGILDEVFEAVVLLTRKRGETYREFIERIADSGNITAIKVKIGDLEDNMDLSRINDPMEKDHDRCKKYAVARAYLIGVLSWLKQEVVE